MNLDSADIPSLLFRGYRRHRFASFLLLRVREGAAARGWLGALLAVDGLQFGPERPGEHVLHVAFSCSGLEALGVEKPFIDTFAPPFREGMTSAHRARILGDVGVNAPVHWSWGGRDDPVDVVLAVYSTGDDDAQHLRRLESEVHSATEHGLEACHVLAAAPLPPASPNAPSLREHFGFADGISQPVWKGSGLEDRLSERGRRLHQVEAGEFVMGQKNAYDIVTPVPRIQESHPPFGNSGSYLVLRQLSQDVAGFWDYFDGQAGREAGEAEPSDATQPADKATRLADKATGLAAKAVGRWPDGSPLATCPHAPDPGQGRRNDFSYADFDADGLRCPVGAHVRRGYPRDSKEQNPDKAIRHANTHRILRRGRSYGRPAENPRERDGESRGLLFLCLNANLERQFEFVQQTWVNDETFDGLKGERDPLIGTQPDAGGRFSVPEDPVRRRLSGIPQFVHVKGGAYFFMPGRKGLTQLSQL